MSDLLKKDDEGQGDLIIDETVNDNESSKGVGLKNGSGISNEENNEQLLQVVAENYTTAKDLQNGINTSDREIDVSTGNNLQNCIYTDEEEIQEIYVEETTEVEESEAHIPYESHVENAILVEEVEEILPEQMEVETMEATVTEPMEVETVDEIPLEHMEVQTIEEVVVVPGSAVVEEIEHDTKVQTEESDDTKVENEIEDNSAEESVSETKENEVEMNPQTLTENEPKTEEPEIETPEDTTSKQPASKSITTLEESDATNNEIIANHSEESTISQKVEEDAVISSLDKNQTVNNDSEVNELSASYQKGKNEMSGKGFSKENIPSYIPPHLLGRDLNNPIMDVIGTNRRVQKPRLGVKIPYRNLTSQIVTQDEIAQEILERSLRKYSYHDVPEGGDVLFAMKLTHRLANKITNSDNNVKEVKNKASTSKEQAKQEDGAKILKDGNIPLPISDITTVAKSPPTETNDKENENVEKKGDNETEQPVEQTEPVNEEPKQVSVTDEQEKKGKELDKKNGNELDKDTLIAILEGSADLETALQESANTPTTPDVPPKPTKLKRKTMLNIDPDRERELALKQLQDFENSRMYRRRGRPCNPIPGVKSVMVSTRKSSSVKKQEKAQGVVTPKVKYEKKRGPKRNDVSFDDSSDGMDNNLPDVPEVKLAIDRYIKTYTNKRKIRAATIVQNTELVTIEAVEPETAAGAKETEVKEKGTEEDSKEMEVVGKGSEEKGGEIEEEEKVTDDEEVETEVQAKENNREESTASNVEENKNSKTKKSGIVAEENEPSSEEAVADEEVPRTPEKSPKKKGNNTRVMREINRLLGDEGAINMIYSIEHKRTPGGRQETGILPSLRRKKKDLILKTKLVKNAVLKLSMSQEDATPSRLRQKTQEKETKAKEGAAVSPASKKTSPASNDSPPVNSKTRKVLAAEASKIIRRHSSSSSSYSSEDESEVATTPQDSSQKEKNTNVMRKRSASGPEENEPKIKKANDGADQSKFPTDAPSDLDTPPNDTEKDSTDEDTQVRDIEGFKEIALKQHNTLYQIILIMESAKVKDSINLETLQELIGVLTNLQDDSSCHAVLITSAGNTFCRGLDILSIINANVEERAETVSEFASTLEEFVKCLSDFKKPILAGVHAAAVGFGVTMLPFFDMVLASDKATFQTPYARLGQIPEGAATLTLPQLLGTAVTNELLFGCRTLTATEASQFGLVTRVLWPERFQEELLTMAKAVASQSLQSMVATKSLLRQELRSRLGMALELESKLLLEHWCSEECQEKFKTYLHEEALLPPHGYD